MVERRLLLYSDLHLKTADPYGIPHESGSNTRVLQKLHVLRQVVDIAIEKEVDTIVDLGDLFDTANPSTRLRNLYAETIYTAFQHRISLYRVLGNHETDGQQGVGQDISILSGSEDYRVFSSIQNSLYFTYIPEVPTKEIVQFLRSCPDDTIILGHFEVTGGSYANGKPTSGVPGELLSERKFPTFLGHIHKRQFLCGGKAIHIGAAARDDYGDAEITPGCCLLTVTTDVEKVVDCKYTFIDLVDCHYRKFYFEEGVDTSGQVQDVSEGDIVKLVYKGSSSWFTAQDSSNLQRLLTASGANKVVVEWEPTETVQETVDIVEESEDISIESMVEANSAESPVLKDKGLAYLASARAVGDSE